MRACGLVYQPELFSYRTGAKQEDHADNCNIVSIATGLRQDGDT